jgi:hypothetical protein
MKLFWKKSQVPAVVIPPELQPYYGNRSRTFDWRRWLLPIGVLVALIVIAVIVWVIVDRADNRTTPAGNQYQQSPQNNPKLEESKGTPAKTDASGETNSGTVPVE